MNALNVSRKRQGGFTMIELLIVVAAALILITIGVSLYTRFISGSNSISATSSLAQLANDVRGMHRGRPYTGLDAALVANAGKGPDAWRRGTTFVTDWGSTVALGVANYQGGTANAFTVQLPGVDRDACNSIVSNNEGQFRVIEVGAAATGGTVVKNLGAATPVLITTAAVVTACNRESSFITFTGV